MGFYGGQVYIRRRFNQRLCWLRRWATEASAEVAPRLFQRSHVFQEDGLASWPRIVARGLSFYLRFAVPALSSSSFGFNVPPEPAVLFDELVLELGAEPSFKDEL
jgi:hypothetical protein